MCRVQRVFALKLSSFSVQGICDIWSGRINSERSIFAKKGIKKNKTKKLFSLIIIFFTLTFPR
jgi:hypothetical protein